MLRTFKILQALSIATLLVGCATGPRFYDRYMDRRAQSLHTGLDLAGYIGEPVYAPRAGTVIGASPEFIMLEHDTGQKTSYYHIDSVTLERGARVAQGQQIARLALTGIQSYEDRRNIRVPHLHLELKTATDRGQDPESLKMTCDGLGGWRWPVGCGRPTGK